jgi:hypothetical protein
MEYLTSPFVYCTVEVAPLDWRARLLTRGDLLTHLVKDKARFRSLWPSLEGFYAQAFADFLTVAYNALPGFAFFRHAYSREYHDQELRSLTSLLPTEPVHARSDAEIVTLAFAQLTTAFSHDACLHDAFQNLDGTIFTRLAQYIFDHSICSNIVPVERLYVA